ncbi:MAG: shikimate kinase [Promethearchaeota archaeon]
MKENITLIGFMGTGKTSIGKRLAEKFNKEFIDLDGLIEKQTNKSISEIFKEGENKFRELEKKNINMLKYKRNFVLSCGGGVILNNENMKTLQQISIIILLEATKETIFKHIIKDGKEKRPLLNKEDPIKEIGDILRIRKPLYDKFASFRIIIDDKSIKEVINEIIEILGNI